MKNKNLKILLLAKVTLRAKVTHRVVLSLCQIDTPVSLCHCAKVTLRAKVTHRVDLTTVSFCSCAILTRSHFFSAIFWHQGRSVGWGTGARARNPKKRKDVKKKYIIYILYCLLFLLNLLFLLLFLSNI